MHRGILTIKCGCLIGPFDLVSFDVFDPKTMRMWRLVFAPPAPSAPHTAATQSDKFESILRGEKKQEDFEQTRNSLELDHHTEKETCVHGDESFMHSITSFIEFHQNLVYRQPIRIPTIKKEKATRSSANPCTANALVLNNFAFADDDRLDSKSSEQSRSRSAVVAEPIDFAVERFCARRVVQIAMTRGMAGAVVTVVADALAESLAEAEECVSERWSILEDMVCAMCVVCVCYV